MQPFFVGDREAVRGDPIGLFIRMSKKEELETELPLLQQFTKNRQAFFDWLTDQPEESPADKTFKKDFATAVRMQPDRHDELVATGPRYFLHAGKEEKRFWRWYFSAQSEPFHLIFNVAKFNMPNEDAVLIEKICHEFMDWVDAGMPTDQEFDRSVPTMGATIKVFDHGEKLLAVTIRKEIPKN